MKPKQIANLEPVKIFAHAAGFHKSYDMLIRSAAPHPGARADEQLIGIVAHPAMVLSVFASELYLKTLLCIETGLVPNTHDLNLPLQLDANSMTCGISIFGRLNGNRS